VRCDGPANTTVILILPAADEKTVVEGDQRLAQAKGVKRIVATPGQVMLELEGSSCEFRSDLAGVNKR